MPLTPPTPLPSRRLKRRLLLGAALAVVTAISGCSGSSLDTDDAGDGTLTIGLVWPQSGPYETIGVDQARGWQLYLDSHGGKLGGLTVKTPATDEGSGAPTALAAAKKLVDADQATVLVGTASGETNAAIAQYATDRKLPFVGAGGRASVIKDVTWVWNTSWLSKEMGAAVAPYIAQTVKGPVYAIGPDYQGGWDQMGGFTDKFIASGGKLANSDGKTTWTPWPATKNYLPFLSKIADTDAKAVYTFYAGTSAVDFVKQYQQSGLKLPLYAAGFLTEGAVLEAQGAAATGVYTVLNYAANLDNPANRAFAPAYQQKHGTAPTIFSVAGWDAALVLDQAITAAGPNPTPKAINDAIGKLGTVASPRGDWRFGGQHSPIQAYYLRQVKPDGRTQANVVQQTLTTLSN
ncbi:ABC transporter substrate-binding protein [Actinoplanes sp. NPDC000266]